MAFPRHFIIGGSGDQSAATNNAGGAYRPSDGGSYTSFQGSDGAPLDSDTVGSVLALNGPGGFVKLQVGDGSGHDFVHLIGVAGVYVNVDFGSVYVDDRYEVLSVEANGDYILLGEFYSADDTVTSYYVGGALDTDDVGWQVAFDEGIAGDHIAISADCTFGATVMVDTNSGTEADKIIIEAVDETTGVRLTVEDTLPVIVPSAALGNGVFLLSNSIDYTDWHLIVVNGDGGGANVADHGWDCNDSGCRFHRLFNCRVYDTNAACILAAWRYGLVSQCIASGSTTGEGIRIGYNNNTVVGCTSYENATYGIIFSASYSTVESNTCYGNGSDGIYVGADASHIVHNTCVGNAGSGIELTSGAQGNNVWNNICVDNSDGENYKLINSNPRHNFFGYNHSHGSATHTDVVADGAWADLLGGGNTSGDPLFVDKTNHNYTLQSHSPASQNGFPPYMAVDADFDAITNYMSKGTIQRKEPAGNVGRGFHRGVV
jgi:hypothetical protein